MSFQYIFPVILLLAFGAFAFSRMSKMSGAVANAGPAMLSFLQRTGYRYPDMAPEPVDPHAQRAISDMTRLVTQGGDREVVRNVQGVPVTFAEGSKISDRGYSFWSQWSAPTAQPARVLFHIADQSLGGVRKAAAEIVTNVESSWQPRYGTRVQTGNPQLDGRFAIFAQDPAAMQAYLARTPALVGMLLQCALVDLWTEPQRAAFADPMAKNVNAAVGAGVLDPAARIEASIPVHERISEILSLVVRSV